MTLKVNKLLFGEQLQTVPGSISHEYGLTEEIQTQN